MGSPDAVRELADVLQRAPWTGLPGRRDVRTAAGVDADDAGVPVLGDVDDVREAALRSRCRRRDRRRRILSSAADLRRLGWALQGLELDMLVVPSLTDIAGPRVHMRHVAGLPLVQVEEPQSDAAGGLAETGLRPGLRQCAACWRSSPLPMLVTLLIIRLQDGGPVFYRQRRVGQHGEEFEMIKFRSMVVDADARRAELAHANEARRRCCSRSARTPGSPAFGRFIRKYSIDELPQLFNVLRGEMSLVGPRPPLPDEVERVPLRRAPAAAGPAGDDRAVAGLAALRPVLVGVGPAGPLLRRQLVDGDRPGDHAEDRASRAGLPRRLLTLRSRRGPALDNCRQVAGA